MKTHAWQFAARFRRNAFGWRSGPPVQRIREALAEIRQVARKEPVLAAEGAVRLLEKLSPALMQVDSSSGALGAAVDNAIQALVPVIAGAEIEPAQRQRWLERLWQALQDDEMPYIESLADYWGELCATPALASRWADRFIPEVQSMWRRDDMVYGYFKGAPACLSALLAAGRYDELLALIDQKPARSWHFRRWGVQALVSMGRHAEAISYAEQFRVINDPDWQIAQVCESILLSSGQADEAYRRYAVAANQRGTYLAIFRAIGRKYPHKQPEQILHDLVASTPGEEGKWFAAAKDAGLFDAATALARRSPTDPRTLTRAARDFAGKQPHFALAAGLAALHWLAQGHGYEISGNDVLEAYAATVQAADAADEPVQQINDQIRQMIARAQPGASFMAKVLAGHLSN